MRILASFLATLFAIGGAIAASPAALAGVVLDAPGHVCIEGESVAARGGEPGAAWTLLDWRGRETGHSGVFDEKGEARLPPLATGYYRMTPSLATLAVVPPPETRVFDHDSFYGTDSALSWSGDEGCFDCPWNGGDTYRTVSDLLWRAGIPHVRDRLAWGGVHPEPDVARYGKYMDNAEMLRARGILISEVFADAPRWVATRPPLWPDRLAAIHDGCARLAADFGDRIGDWEFWNEPDISVMPPWDAAAALKAAYLGFKAGRADVTVLPGSLCAGPESAFARALYANDAAKFGDVFNYHSYVPPASYPTLIASLRAFMERHGIGDRAIWLTESGSDIEGPAVADGPMAGMKAHSPSQEMVVAEFYPKSQIALQMEGVARNYAFLFCPYNERGGSKDWGHMRRDGTMKPVYAAMSAMTRELVSAKIVGEIKVGDGARAFLFEQPDGSQTVAFWAVSPLDTARGPVVSTAEPDFARGVELPTTPQCEEFFRLSDMCGMVSTVSATNGVLVLPATRFPSYVSGLRGLIADVPAHPAGKVSPYVPADDEDLSVIFRVDLDEGDFELENGRTSARLKGDSGRLRLQVWNLGDTTKTGCIEVAGATLSGVPETVVVGPRGTPPAEFDCRLAPGPGADAYPTLVLQGVFNGRRTSRLAIPLLLPKKLFGSCTAEPLAWRDLKRWERNDSAKTYSATWDEEEEALRFEFAWENPGVGRWFYPVYSLLPEESLADAMAIQFEVKSAQDKVENDFTWCYCMLLWEGRGDRYIGYTPPVGTWEKRIAFLRDCDSLEDVRKFRLGVNPKGMKCTLWVRNIEVVRKEEEP